MQILYSSKAQFPFSAKEEKNAGQRKSGKNGLFYFSRPKINECGRICDNTSTLSLVFFLHSGYKIKTEREQDLWICCHS
jgi:hypothetical protein